METREFWFFTSLVVIALSASISFVCSATYIPVKKIPSALKLIANSFHQNLYFILVLSLFATLIGLGIYVPLVYDLLQSQNTNEIVRTVLLSVFTISLFVFTLSHKKQTLSTSKIVVHAVLASFILVVATQENTLDFYNYPYILLILALFAIVRYGVRTFIKKL